MASKIQFKYYTGFGYNSSSNPYSLTFNFAITLLYSLGTYGISNAVGRQQMYTAEINVSTMTTSYSKANAVGLQTGTPSNSNGGAYAKKSSDNKTVYWYTDTNEYYRAEAHSSNGVLYYFLGLS